jgi:ubiquinone/menaquinone biosynthesis C-methylase UbiE
MKHKPKYGNWIRVRVIVLLCFISVLFLGSGFIPWHIVFRILMFCLSGLAIITTFIVMYAYLSFSSNGGKYQKKIYNLLIDNFKFSGEGTCLDIGTGNGALIIEFAKRHPLSICIGLDYWGKNWEYSRQICEENAMIEGVNNRVSFRQGTASKLPFENEQFDAVISSLAFHEVKDTNDKILLIKEALRVLKKGSKFSFFDLFFDKKYYGEINSLSKNLDSLGLEDYSVKSIGEIISLPPILRYHRVLGLAGVIFGTK